MQLYVERWSSPVSTLLIVTDENGVLRALDFADYEPRMHRLLRSHYGEVALDERKSPRAITRALGAYFDGQLDAPDEIPTATGGTAFQRKVWKGLRNIPAGATISYGELATEHRPSERFARGRRRQWPEPDRDRCPVSSCDRCEWQAHRLRRRNRAQAMAARSRTKVRRGADGGALKVGVTQLPWAVLACSKKHSRKRLCHIFEGSPR